MEASCPTLSDEARILFAHRRVVYAFCKASLSGEFCRRSQRWYQQTFQNLADNTLKSNSSGIRI
jgi:hypothetical protein